MVESQERAEAGAGDYALPHSRVEEVLSAIARGDSRGLAQILDTLHPADIADLMEQVGDGTRKLLLRFWGRELDGEVLSELDEALRAEVISTLPKDVLSEALRDLDSDDVVDLVEDLDAAEQTMVLDVLPKQERVAAERALAYPEDSAGRLMQSEVVSMPDGWTVGQAIDYLRADDGLPEQFYHVILVDPAMRPTGYVQLGRLLGTRREVRLDAILEPSFRTVAGDTPEEDVAYAFNQYHLISMPVVDDAGRLAGVITIDDAMIVLDAENEEDMLRMAGVNEESSLLDNAFDTARYRLPWLLVGFVNALIVTVVIGAFEASIEEIVALAILMPVCASIGGSAGSQSLTVAVRSLATKDLTPANRGRVLAREIKAGLMNGVILAVLLAAYTLLRFGTGDLAGVIAMSMLITITIACTVGFLVPVVMDSFGIDPALASGTFVTTSVDALGFLVFLGLATVVLL